MQMADHGCTESSERLTIVTTIGDPTQYDDEDGQIDNVEHKTHMQHLNKYRPVPLRTDENRNWMIRDHFHDDSASRA